MTKNSVADWSTDPAANTDVGGINIGENCPPSNINNAMREMMAQLAAFETSLFQKQYPVGSLYLTTINTNPETTLGIGTWSLYASGRALVGVGTADGETWTGGQEKGAATHTLTATQMPEHTHGPGTLVGLTTEGEGEHDHAADNAQIFEGSGAGNGQVQGGTGAFKNFFPTGQGQHQHTISVTGGVTGSSGSGASHNNIQPSIGVYVWQRTE